MLQKQLIFAGFETIAWTIVSLLCVAAAATLILLLLRYERKLVPPRVGNALLVSRLVLLGLLCLMFFQPVLSWRLDRRKSGRILVALDLSESMSTTDSHAPPDEKLRWARAVGLIGNEANKERIDRWIEAYQQGREPVWIDPTETGNEAQRRQLAMARQENLRNVFDELDRLSRKEFARRLLQETSAPLLEELALLGDLELIGFAGDSLSSEEKSFGRLVESPPANLQTEKSDLSVPLAATSSVSSSPVLGVVLLTDGRDNTGRDLVALAEQLGRTETALFPVLFGSQVKPKDLSIASLNSPQSASRDDTPLVTAVVNTTGFQGEEIEITLEPEAGESIVQRIVPTSESSPIQFQLEAAELGRHNYTIRIETKPDEIRDDNNTRSFTMNVVDEKIDMLLIDGEARWEFRFLDNALARDKNITARRIVFRQPYLGLLEEPFFPRGLFPDQGEAEPDQNLFTQNDLVILGDVAPADLPESVWEQLESFVADDGGTLVFAAGKQHLPLGDNSPHLQRLLPLTDLRAVLIDDATGLLPPAERGFHLRLTPEAENEAMFQFHHDATANRRLWSELPGHLWGALGKAKPAATVFLHAIGGEVAQNDNPDQIDARSAVCVHQFYGAGQVLYLGIDSTWRWRYRTGDTYHHRFWGQMGRWAAENKAAAGNEFVQFGPDRTDLEFGEQTVLRARWSQRFLKQFPNLISQVELYRTDLNTTDKPVTTVTLKPRAEHRLVHEAQLTNLPIGDYRLKLVTLNAELGPNEIWSPLYIKPPTTHERNDLTTNPQLLKQLAEAANGRMLLPDEIHELPRLLQDSELTSRVQQETELWNHWIMLAAFFSLLGIEWIVRKLNGLP